MTNDAHKSPQGEDLLSVDAILMENLIVPARQTEGMDWQQIHFIEENNAPVIIAFLLFGIVGAAIGMLIGWSMWG